MLYIDKKNYAVSYKQITVSFNSHCSNLFNISDCFELLPQVFSSVLLHTLSTRVYTFARLLKNVMYILDNVIDATDILDKLNHAKFCFA